MASLGCCDLNTTRSMARTKTKEGRDASDPLVRVRGGRNGVRFIALSVWKDEINERKQRKIKRSNKLKDEKRNQQRKPK